MANTDTLTESRSKLQTGAASPRTLRLLVVTQDAEIQTFIHTLSEHQRVQAALTGTVQEAAHFLQNHDLQPDVVVLDISVLPQHALSFLRQLRQRVKFQKLPVLVLTAFPDPDQVREALAAGANRYLTKTFIYKNLLSTLHEMLG